MRDARWMHASGIAGMSPVNGAALNMLAAIAAPSIKNDGSIANISDAAAIARAWLSDMSLSLPGGLRRGALRLFVGAETKLKCAGATSS